MKICIVGLGYVGLPLALEFVKKRTPTIGLDIDENKLGALKLGKSYIKDIEDSAIESAIKSGCLELTADFKCISRVDTVIICVPTPLNKNREPNLSLIVSAAAKIGVYLKKDTLVVLESTSYPGTTDELLSNELEKASELKAGRDFYLGFSPERIDPGNKTIKLAQIPKVVSGLTKTCLQKVIQTYSEIFNKVIPVSSCRTAEATKLLENVFRCVNIALVNELKMIYDAMGIDIWEVIYAASTKPYGFVPFMPGPGLGGHCIPIDPFYLSWKAKEYGLTAKFIELAGEINSYMPNYVINKIIKALNKQSKSVQGSRILLIGITYKPNIEDVRESPSIKLMEALNNLGSSVDYHDPFVEKLPPSNEHPFLTEYKTSIRLESYIIASYDLVVVVTAHDNIDYRMLAENSKAIVDTRNIMNNKIGLVKNLVKA